MARRFVPVTMGSPKFDVVEFDWFRVTDARFPPLVTLPPHFHERNIFAVILEGSWEEVFRSKTYSCRPSSVLTEPAGERHSNRFERAGARVLVVEPDTAERELLTPCAHVFDSATCFEDRGVTTIARRVVREIRDPDGLSHVAIEGLLLEMLVAAARRSASPKPGLPQWLARARDLLHDRFLDTTRIGDVAVVVGVHPAHLARAFRAHFGVSLGTYQRQLRLDWAAEELCKTESTLAETALRAGFADQSHFTRAFKRHTGLTPDRYRRARGWRRLTGSS